MPEPNTHNSTATATRPPKERGFRAWLRRVDGAALVRLARHIRPHAKAACLGGGMMVLSSLSSLALLWMVKYAFAPIINPGATGQRDPSDGAGAIDAIVGLFRELLAPAFGRGALGELSAVTALVLCIAAVRSVAMSGQIYFTSLVGQRLVADLRQRVYAHLMRLSVGFYDNRKTGELMSRLTNDMNALQIMLVNTMVEMLTAPIIILGGMTAVLLLSWRLTLLAFICVPLIVGLIRVAGNRMSWAANQSLLRLGDLSDMMQERLSAIRVVHTFGTEATEVAAFGERNEKSFRARMREARVQAVALPTIELLAAGGLAVALWFGGREALMPTPRLQPGEIITFVAFIQQIYSHFKRLGTVALVLQQVSAAARRIFALLDEEPRIREAADARPLPRLAGGVRFDHVHFSYNGGESVLNDVSFEVSPGEVVALVGSSGAGKTTVASLVPRLYDATQGSVLVDGHDLREVRLLSLRSQLGVVPQETVLFSGSIRENILYGKPDADQAAVEEAARQANAAEFIDVLEEGYDTVVGERGTKLSGGQRQRIAIARALLRDPRILILDEATSSLDAKSESLVQQALETLMSGRTTLVIAHRLSTIRKADRILVLHEGRIVEEGAHEELMHHNGHYARLYEIQTGGRGARASSNSAGGSTPAAEAAAA